MGLLPEVSGVGLNGESAYSPTWSELPKACIERLAWNEKTRPDHYNKYWRVCGTYDLPTLHIS
ncbi:hypothetical protein LHL20_14915 [Alteromonas sp. McT4-15]|uniref:hypothetical protein n=1 Tax=Alteromonas sp. McT4-15 TaxID=2881256 RepID=UPI001CF8D386|nr:hypothetical protein [Alteromonas sp. McT4-15]MCB4437522.1 hypothetical protein [Alteromonas sp. McT4-15]